MDHLRLLYKVNGSLLSPKNSKRRDAKEMRATKRSDMYSSTRNISLSPRQENLADQQKENFKPPLTIVEATPGGETAPGLGPPSSKISEKQSRQKAYLMRFLAWKAEKAKQAQLKEQQSRRAPFVVPTGGPVATEARNSKKSFAPRRHAFHLPANLKDVTVEMAGINSVRCITGEQQATYHFVETPKKKQNLQSKVASVKSCYARTMPVSKILVPKPTVHKTTVASIPVREAMPKLAVTTTKPELAVPSGSNKKTPAAASKQTPNTAVNSKLLRFPQSSQKSTVKSENKPGKTPIRPKIPPPLKLAPKPLENPQNKATLKSKMPPPSQQAPRIARKAQMSTAGITKASTKLGNCKSGLPPLKRPTFKASKKSNASISNALLAVNANTRSKVFVAPPTFKLNGKSLLQSMTQTTKLADPIPETPTDPNPANSYLNFVTSTKRKSSSSKDLKADLLFAELGNTISPVDDSCPTPSKQDSKQKDDNKFDFIRYSIVQSDKDNTTKPEEAANAETSDKPNEETNTKTPEKIAGPPTTYMSPYVSVSRGKVSTKIEREKRNSIYMAADNPGTATPEMTTTVRRTLATVRYYRKQLIDEIARLNDMCGIWEQYKEANAQLVEDGGIDMINVTIGQTKLLTTKKLKQFGGLIDRCEDGVLGKSSTCSGGGEGAKLILPEDLEGFWTMVGLQIENVEKRFAELERWKANNWTDPDEVPVKATNSHANVKRTKQRKPASTARPNGALQKMLRTAHAAYLNKKALGGTDEDVILTPSKSRQVVIRDRRSRSAAATVITVNTPRMNRKSPPSTDLNETPKLLPHINGFRKSINLLKNTLMGEQERKSSPVTDCVSPVRRPSAFRKSILKTPGSKSRPKSVIFNSPTLKFTIEGTIDDAGAMSNAEQEDDQRTYKLRNRRIILRDSAEFVIPK